MPQIKLSNTSNILEFVLTSSVDGEGITGLTFSSTGLRIGTKCNNEATTTAYTAAGSTIETISTLGTFAAPTATKCRFKEVDATSHPGLYQFQFADARFAIASSKKLTITVSGAASNIKQTNYEVDIVGYDPNSALAVQTKLDTVEGLAVGSSGFAAIKAETATIVAKTALIPAVPASQAKLDTVESLASGATGFNALSALLVAIQGTGYSATTMSLSAAFAAAITSQEIRNSLLLAPVGTAAATSIDTKLSNILGNLKLQKNTAGQVVYFYIRSTTTPAVGLVVSASLVTIERAIDSTAGFGTATGTKVAMGNGYYALVTSAADTNGTSILFRATASGGIEDPKVAYTHV